MKVASREKIWSKNITKLETFQKNIYFLKVKWASFKRCKSGSIYFLAILGSDQWLMLTYSPNHIPLIGAVANS